MSANWLVNWVGQPNGKKKLEDAEQRRASCKNVGQRNTFTFLFIFFLIRQMESGRLRLVLGPRSQSTDHGPWSMLVNVLATATALLLLLLLLVPQ